MCIQGENITALNLVSQYQLVGWVFLIKWWFGSSRLSALSVSFKFFFQEGGSGYITCCHLKFEILLKPNSSLILPQDLTFQIIGRQSLGLCQKNHKKRSSINEFGMTVKNAR